ncbi:MAG: SsrA-binding protein [Candidatus Yanofskybacteria bacterium CG10_big_fil_rev_8_21_14_0_10_46_23]|uniref:SsrA-binding protein n=1 Tax=Candidatus Yanofskybacteria bacterium CG10_big_fil_rev_8_21_14_0_10_46_23 TaxID=1975098 RepID=A0A2H0R452_9BACT|nr:MAG: SsrA-binding protein [Candidatus Yanofskybacteria bacterium CG10_big_fil_rev_8_21_14_0_10_46_23]
MPSYAKNPQALRDFEILERFEAGVMLLGHEVKSIKTGKGSIRGTFIKAVDNELWLIGATIPPYQPQNITNAYDAQRSRKLLLRAQELNRLVGRAQEAGMSIVPLSLYSKRGLIKLEIGLGRGKKKHDKREAIKKREAERTIRQTVEID